MNKVFISCPMRGRTDEEIMQSINKMHQIAEVLFGEKLEPVHNFVKGDEPPTDSMRIWLLGEAIKKMASCKYFIGVQGAWDNPGCCVENDVADFYMGRDRIFRIDQQMIGIHPAEIPIVGSKKDE